MTPYMNSIIKRAIVTLVPGLIVATGCRQVENRSAQINHAGIPVTVSHVRTGQMLSYMELSATSAFLFKAAVKAPATGYIDDILINQGDAVGKSQPLLSIKTKEAAAIMNDSLNSMNFSGIITVKAATSGLIASIGHTRGDYVAEGDQLCEIAITESFVFILDVPFEMSGFIRLHSPCEIILPDSQSLKGVIKTSFPSMAVNSQTERFIVKLAEPKSLPENLTSKIRIIKESVNSAVSLPKSCILTDETMQQFWVMKLINDSMAVKVPVTTGITEGENVQVTRPLFSTSDLFLASGNYGLGDTVYVKVVNKTMNEKQ
jgi:biotin carboxyl carrier protein